jgi:type IV pilus assembly protein PilA
MIQHIQENEKGFTLIEIMIVIAIIGILAAIAIPNYISYRDKTFCTAAESDAHSLVNGLYAYFAVPVNQTYSGGGPGTSIQFSGVTTVKLSGINTGTIVPIGTSNQFRISITDNTARCPLTYRNADPRWSAAVTGTYTMTL